ncbi:hypothetical protein ACH347_05095 [Saccharopolyspora sp. 5N102]|uniref:hypothetical protein n=1 Tax=Saccharopolyspora sp. 5N102 TaxID=3375155 RepID=UPI00378D756C
MTTRCRGAVVEQRRQDVLRHVIEHGAARRPTAARFPSLLLRAGDGIHRGLVAWSHSAEAHGRHPPLLKIREWP